MHLIVVVKHCLSCLLQRIFHCPGTCQNQPQYCAYVCKTSRVDALQTICIDLTNNAIKKGYLLIIVKYCVCSTRYSVMLAYRDDNIFWETLFSCNCGCVGYDMRVVHLFLATNKVQHQKFPKKCRTTMFFVLLSPYSLQGWIHNFSTL